MSIKWTIDLGPEEAVELTKRLVEQEDLFKRLEKIIDASIKESTEATINSRGFDNPSWAFHQAFLNGQLNALTAIKTVIQLRD